MTQHEAQHEAPDDRLQKTEQTSLIDLKREASLEENHDKSVSTSRESFTKYQTIFAYIVFLFSVIFFCASHISVQYLGGAVPENELNALRFAVGVPMSACFLRNMGGESRLIARKQWLPFAFVVWIGLLYNTTLYTASAYAPLGVVGGLSIATAIITNAIFSICIKSERKLGHYIGSVVSVIGIILLAQPDFIFHPGAQPKNETVWVSPCLDSLNLEGEHKKHSVNFGMLLAVLSGVAMAFQMHAMRHVTITHNPFTVTCWLSFWASAISAVLMGIFETPRIPTGWFCILMLAVHCVAMSQYIMTLLFTLNRVSVLATNLLAALELPILLISQYTFMKHIIPGKENWVEVIGAILCFFGSIGGTLLELGLSWYKKE